MTEGRIAALDTPAGLKSRYGADNLYDVFYKVVGS